MHALAPRHLGHRPVVHHTAACLHACSNPWLIRQHTTGSASCAGPRRGRVAALATSSTVADAKADLLELLFEARRGSNADKMLRGQIEEAQVDVEGHSPAELDYTLLAGKWKLLYTTAADVVPILSLDSPLLGVLPAPLQVGNIYQNFSDPDTGIVQNIIEFGVWPWTREQDGVTFTVEASYEVVSPRRISLTFQEAAVGRVALSGAAEAALAPALLPRGYWNMRLLQAIQEFSAVFPFRSAQQLVQGRGVGAPYLLTYLDDTMLIGRASGTAGTFIFSREQPQQPGWL